MQRTRRSFFRECSLIAAGLALPLAGVAAPARRSARFMPLQKLNFQTFSRQLNTTFQVRLADGSTVPLKLIGSTQGKPQKSAGPQRITYENFSLIFTGPPDRALRQCIHAFEHPRIGQFEIFIVPILSDDISAVHYECIFNRPLVKSARNQ